RGCERSRARRIRLRRARRRRHGRDRRVRRVAMNVLLYRRSLRLKSGAGELIRSQAAALREHGHRVLVGGERGVLDYWLRTRLPVRRITPERAAALAADPAWIVADHGLRVPSADLVFVHNLMSEANEYLRRPEAEVEAAHEAAYFR